jgi:hypothetical protein
MSHETRLLTKNSATNFALQTVVLMARARIPVNIHPFPLGLLQTLGAHNLKNIGAHFDLLDD